MAPFTGHMRSTPQLAGVDFHLSIAVADGAWLAAVDGELDLATLPMLKTVVDAMPRGAEVVVDLRKSTFVSFSSLVWISEANVAAHRAGGAVHLRNPPASVRRVLSCGRLLDLYLDLDG